MKMLTPPCRQDSIGSPFEIVAGPLNICQKQAYQAQIFFALPG